MLWILQILKLGACCRELSWGFVLEKWSHKEKNDSNSQYLTSHTNWFNTALTTLYFGECSRIESYEVTVIMPYKCQKFLDIL